MTWVSLFNRAELGDYRLPVGSGTGGPCFVSPDAPKSVSEPLKVESNSRIPMPLEYWLTGGFFNRLTRGNQLIITAGCPGGGEG